MRRIGLDRRIILEPEPVDRHDMREIQSVSQDEVWMTADALLREPQHVRAVLGLRHWQVVGSCTASPHTYDAPAFAHFIRPDARAACSARSVRGPAPSVKRALQSLLHDLSQSEIDAEVAAGALGRVQHTAEIAIENDVALSNPCPRDPSPLD